MYKSILESHSDLLDKVVEKLAESEVLEINGVMIIFKDPNVLSEEAVVALNATGEDNREQYRSFKILENAIKNAKAF